MSVSRGKQFLGIYLFVLLHNVNSKKISNSLNPSQVEVRAVFINCEVDGRQDSPILRFERQELFKHNALRGCHKKLALTMKITSPDPSVAENTDSDSKKITASDEYIPIDHVLEGSDKKRVRLLNPYILRLRRDIPKQAYKLRRIDTVTGILTKVDLMNRTSKQVKTRERRDLEQHETGLLGSAASVFSLDHEAPRHRSYFVRIGRLQEPMKPSTATLYKDQHQASLDCDKRDVYLTMNTSSLEREKRQEQMSMTVLDGAGVTDNTPKYIGDSFLHESGEESNEDDYVGDIDDSTQGYVADEVVPRHSKTKPKDRSRHKLAKNIENARQRSDNGKNIYSSAGLFGLYEIENPCLWYDIKVHLFEKLSTPEGKTVWKDLTQGADDASVSSGNPEWSGQDVNVRYRPAEWVPRDEFMLPLTKLYLLEPLRDNTTFSEDDTQQPNVNQNYIIVPVEDVVYMDNKKNIKKRDENITRTYSNNDTSSDPNDQNETPSRVEVRVSRAIMGSPADQFEIARVGSERFLTLPHRRLHHSQIDVEVKADDNMLVRVGSSGRLATVVTDNTRRKRTTVYFQATNTGLAPARFKGVVRECGPELNTQLKEQGSEEISSESFLLPPHHTRRVKLVVPAEITTDITHCNVALVNDEDELVAVRELSIKKGDRCFCVWHCDCVCLSDDPKLLCRDMAEARQVAAGLAPAERPRRARSVCYKDNRAIDFCTVLLAILIFLLSLGIFKACLGIVNIKAEQFGWERLLARPYMMSCYYEPCLRNRIVVYVDGWPVHPDTKKRTVRVLSRSGGFLLNLFFFIIVPCLAFYAIIQEFVTLACNCLRNTRTKIKKSDKQIYSAHDLQTESLELIVRKKKHKRLADWMTPLAEQLTSDVIRHSMEPALAECERNEKKPLLESCCQEAVAEPHVPDSEQEDTEYVLEQMKKSRESLAKNQNQ